MKAPHLFLLLCLLTAAGAVVGDRYYAGRFQEKFKAIEKERIVTSNKLATAKIVYENLNHVRDLVFKNMDFPGQKDSISHESRFFEFLTTCINDLKLNLVSVKPDLPVTRDRVTLYAYDLELEGDFFKFGELCAKFENSRRIIALDTYEVEQILAGPAEKPGKANKFAAAGNKGIRVKMRVSTFRVKKAVASSAQAGVPG